MEGKEVEVVLKEGQVADEVTVARILEEQQMCSHSKVQSEASESQYRGPEQH